MSELAQSKKRGRPVTTGTNQSIGVRLPPETLESIDAWRARQPGIPGRPEAIRRLIEAGLKERQVDAPSGGGNPGPTSRGKLGASRVPHAKKPTERKAEPGAPISKEAQIRALREQGAR
jgi:hypothetical protein